MQTLKVEVQDNLLEKILWLLNNFKGVRVQPLTEKDLFWDDMKKSEDDILNDNISSIENIDDYIQELKDETS